MYKFTCVKHGCSSALVLLKWTLCMLVADLGRQATEVVATTTGATRVPIHVHIPDHHVRLNNTVNWNPVNFHIFSCICSAKYLRTVQL